MVNFNYNVSEIKPTTSFDPLPSGWYVAQITATEAKVPKSGQGEMVCITYEVIDGEFRGRKLWSNLCHEHPNKDTQDIARRHISAINHAIGDPYCDKSEKWYQIPLKIKVKLKRDKNTDELVNEITGYAAIERIAPAKAAPNPAAGKQAEEATPPWMRDMPEAAQ